jgi:hypothetical protein
VRSTGHYAKTPQAATGIFVLLRGRGSGARRVSTETMNQDTKNDGKMVLGNHFYLNKIQIAATFTVITALALLASASPAAASSLHAFSEAFPSTGGLAGSAAGELSAPSSVAVNSLTHDVYVTDPGNHRVDEFTATGEFLLAFGADVGGEGVNTCTLSCEAGTSGSAAGQFEKPDFIAVDSSTGASSGDVYVGDTGTGTVQKFTGSGELVESWGEHGAISSDAQGTGTGNLTAGSTEVTGVETDSGALEQFFKISGEGIPAGAEIAATGEGTLTLSAAATATAEHVSLIASRVFGGVDGVAVDGAGNLWVHSKEGDEAEFAPSGEQLETFEASGSLPDGTAVDNAGRVYFNSVLAFTTTGSSLGQVTNASATGLAADLKDNNLYVDLGGSIQHFEASCEPASAPCTPTESFGAPALPEGQGVAVDSSNGTVYAANVTNNVVDAFPATLEASTLPASGLTASTAILNASVNPLGSSVSECFFEYGATTEYGHDVPCEGVITGETEVHAALTGLFGSTTYHYRVVVGGSAGLLLGEDVQFSTSSVALISGLEVSDVTETSAKLSGLVNPNGMPVETCRFEYGTSSTYEHVVPCDQSAASLGEGSSPLPVTVTLTGLKPDETVHWRLVAKDATGDGASVDQTFVDDTSGGALPDGRRYELVTPAQKNGALVAGTIFGSKPPQMSEDGKSIIASSIQCFGDAQSCEAARRSEGELIDFTRGSASWSAQSLAPPAQFEHHSTWTGTPEGPAATFTMVNPSTGREEFYSRGADGTFTPIGPIGEDPSSSYEQLGAGEVWTTLSGSPLIYRTAASWKSGGDLYQYTGTHNTAPLSVGVSGPQGSNDLITTCETELGDGSNDSTFYGALSANGNIAFFTAHGSQEVGKQCLGSGANAEKEVPADELWARVDGGAASAHSVRISAPTSGVCTSVECIAAPEAGAAFQGATPTGEDAFFTSTQQLTNEASEDNVTRDGAIGLSGCEKTSPGASGCNLYESICPDECSDSSARVLVDVSAGAAARGGPQVQGVMAISPDGSHVYFVADGVLTDSSNGQGLRPRDGASNLYVYDRDTAHPAGTVSFVTTLTGSDVAQWLRGVEFANVTPEGRFLVFTSHRGLTPDAAETGPAQVYQYDAATGGLHRISVGRDGYNDNGNAGVLGATESRITGAFTGDASIVPAEHGFNSNNGAVQRADPTMSHDGSYVFFQSPVALAPGALNDSPTVRGQFALNVYEYHDGVVSLISDGKDASVAPGQTKFAVELFGTDATGANVFFSTNDSLVPQDTDTERDFYDAHICSAGEPCPAPSEGSAPCQEEACHGSSPAPASAAAPASASLSGAGNLTAPAPAPPAKKTPPKPTRAQLLARALKVCHRDKQHKKRVACEHAARKRYGKKASKSAKRSPRRPAGHTSAAKSHTFIQEAR